MQVKVNRRSSATEENKKISKKDKVLRRKRQAKMLEQQKKGNNKTMAKRTMRTEGDEILTKTSRVVEKFDNRLLELIDDMIETMNEHNGVGLAAVQVGMLRRIFVIDIGDGPMEFINPEILETSGEEEDAEGCLSFPKQYGLVTRPTHVKVKAQNKHGEWFIAETEGLFARAVCHENDHLNGLVFKDHIDRLLTEEELEELRQEADAE